MCFTSLFGGDQQPQTVTQQVKQPDAPQPDDDAVRKRAMKEAELLAARGGTAATVKTDLAPRTLVGQRRVLLGV